MKTRALLSALVGAAALLLVGAQPALAGHHGGSGSVVFVQTNELGGNRVAVFNQGSDGRLTQAGSYPTRGLGGAALPGTESDHLASQGSLAYDRSNGLLYAVNAGSDTLTVFAVQGDRLLRRQVIGSGGSFPVSIAMHGNLLYVLNARNGGSVQGYLRVGQHLLPVPSWHRPLGLDPTLTPEFTTTPGQVAFTPDGRKLVVTTKGNGSDIDVFAVNRFGGLSSQPVVNPDPGQVPFAVSFDTGGHLVVAEAANAVATFTINADGTLALVDREPTGQSATCWIVRNGSSFYASNAGSASLSGYSDDGSGALTALGNATTDAGTVDATVSSDGRYLYVQTGANGIVDAFRIGTGGSLTQIGAVTVPGAAGGEGIVAG